MPSKLFTINFKTAILFVVVIGGTVPQSWRALSSGRQLLFNEFYSFIIYLFIIYEILIQLYMYAKNLNGILAVNSPFQTLMVGFVKFID